MRGALRAAAAHPLWTIFLLALALRLGYYVVSRPPAVIGVDSSEYDELGRAFLNGEGLVRGIFIRPPIYIVFVAACYAIGGLVALQLAQLAIGAATAAAIGALGHAMSSDRRAMWASGLLAATYPWFFAYVAALGTETLFTLFAVLAFTGIVRTARGLGSPGIAGIWFGLASLTRANLLPFAAVLVPWLAWRRRGLAPAVVFVVGVVVVLAPLTAYHLVRGNGFIVATTGGGQSFYSANNPDIAALYTDDRLSDEEWRALNSIAPGGERSRAFLGCPPGAPCPPPMSAVETERFYYDAGFRYIRTHTHEWIRLEVAKLVRYWTPWVEPRVYPLAIVILSGISFVGLVIFAIVGALRMPRASREFVTIIALTATATSVIWLAVALRYRFALLDPMLIAAAGGPVALVTERLLRSLSGRRQSAAPG